MKQESLKSAQQHHSSKPSDHHPQHVSQNSGLVGANHLHHPSVQNDLKLGLGGMSHLGMGQFDNKSNQDILKAVSKVNS